MSERREWWAYFKDGRRTHGFIYDKENPGGRKDLPGHKVRVCEPPTEESKDPRKLEKYLITYNVLGYPCRARDSWTATQVIECHSLEEWFLNKEWVDAMGLRDVYEGDYRQKRGMTCRILMVHALNKGGGE